jgi:hypothetical protein
VSMAALADGALADWGSLHLGARPVTELFRTGHLSFVVGVELDDGREVVIKAREPSHRLDAATEIQEALSRTGFPCPSPLAGPAPLGSLTATAENYIARHGPAPEPPPAAPTAALLAQLVECAPPAAGYASLNPAPPWVGWDHDEDKLWPSPDDLTIDMNEHPGPAWVDQLAQAIRDRLASVDSDLKIGLLSPPHSNRRRRSSTSTGLTDSGGRPRTTRSRGPPDCGSSRTTPRRSH